jgi:hypothetical protein
MEETKVAWAEVSSIFVCLQSSTSNNAQVTVVEWEEEVVNNPEDTEAAMTIAPVEAE